MHQTNLFRAHGRPLMRAILRGFAGVAPRSVVPNLFEILLSTLLSRASATAGVGAGAGGCGCGCGWGDTVDEGDLKTPM